MFGRKPLTRCCPECRKYFKPRRPSIDIFCSVKCNAAFEARAMKRTRRIYRALYWWRADRRNCAADLRFICREIASWVKEDTLAGRCIPRHNHEYDRGHERS